MSEQVVVCELYYDGDWQEVPVRLDPPPSIQVGSGDESGGVTPSSMLVVLDSLETSYSPLDPMSPLYGVAGRNTPVRLSVGGSQRFVGEVAVWTPHRDLGGDETVEVQAAGLLRRLQQGAKPLISPLRRWHTDAARAAATVTYIPAEDLRGEPVIGSAQLTGDLSWSADDTVSGSASLPTVGSGGAGVVVRRSTTSQRVFAVFCLVVPDGTADGTQVVRLETDGATLSRLSLVYTGASGGTLARQFYDETGSAYLSAYTLATGIDGLPLHVQVALHQDGTTALSAVQIRTVGPDGSTDMSGAIGDSTFDRAWGPLQGLTWAPGVTVGHVGVGTYTSGLFAAPVGSVLWEDPGEAVSGHQWERAADRIERLCDEAGVDVLIVAGVGAGPSIPMAAQGTATLVSLLSDAAAADGGLLHDADGGVTYRTRSDLYNQDPALVLTAGDIRPPLTGAVDDRDVRNDVTVRSDGAAARAVETEGPMSTEPPPVGIGVYDVSEEVQVASPLLLSAVAAWRLALGTVQQQRWPTVTVEVTEGLVAAVDALRLGDVVVLEDPPAGSPGEWSYLVIGWVETIESHRRQIALHLVPAEPWSVPEVGATGTVWGICGSDTTVIGPDAIDSTQTTIDIWDEGATGWVHDFDFDIRVGGEVMTVTAVGSPSAPSSGVIGHEVTVTRSVNGVVKGHAAGTAVEVWPPNYWGL